MRITAVVPLLFSLIAFILSLLCVFAGSKRGYLENGDLLTVRMAAYLTRESFIADKTGHIAQHLYARSLDPQYLQLTFLIAELDREQHKRRHKRSRR